MAKKMINACDDFTVVLRDPEPRVLDGSRPLNELPGPSSKKRKASDLDPGSESPAKLSRSDKLPPKSSTKTQRGAERRQRERRKRPKPSLLTAGDPADFFRKYDEQEMLGEGGFGCVYAGVRRRDLLPVAIKHIRRANVEFVSLTKSTQQHIIPKEVYLMRRARSGPDSEGRNASVAILDWFCVDHEVILVMERPTPAEDLFDYCIKNAPLPEGLAKEITRQVAEALNHLHERKVFHQDIKLDNVLLQDTPSGPRVRLIDFGCGNRVQSEPYSVYSGTVELAPPEFVLTKRYNAGPTSVWQTGALLYELLRSDKEGQFTTKALWNGDLECPSGLSQECQDFLEACLRVDPTKRLGLDQLSHHPWMRR